MEFLCHTIAWMMILATVFSLLGVVLFFTKLPAMVSHAFSLVLERAAMDAIEKKKDQPK